MDVRIHRGAAEIGGSCIEVRAQSGDRIVVDLGRPLWAELGETVPLPSVEGFNSPDPSLLAVVISHPHLDHYGMLPGLRVDVPLYIGEEAASVLAAASFFSPATARVEPAGHLKDRTPFRIGPFNITPYLNDHSAFDAYSLLIDADGSRLFYTGDIRGHGRKASLYDRLVSEPPASVDVLLMEGTHVRQNGTNDVEFESEHELEERFVEICKTTGGAVVVFGSAQNIDRLVTVFRAARRSGRELAVDLYAAEVASATRRTIPQPGFEGLRVYVPNRQRILVKEAEEFDRVDAIRELRVFPEELAAEPDRFVLHVPSSSLRELIRTGVLDSNGLAIWSLWAGYLQTASGQAFTDDLNRHDIRLSHVHTSGHASVPDLQRLASAFAPCRVVPIHTEAPQRFIELFSRAEIHRDNEWWEV